VKASPPKTQEKEGTVEGIIDKRVKAESGEEGTVVAVAHGGGGYGGWQLLILQDNGRLTVAGAINAQIGA
jgi:hypothetical protein